MPPRKKLKPIGLTTVPERKLALQDQGGTIARTLFGQSINVLDGIRNHFRGEVAVSYILIYRNDSVEMAFINRLINYKCKDNQLMYILIFLHISQKNNEQSIEFLMSVQSRITDFFDRNKINKDKRKNIDANLDLLRLLHQKLSTVTEGEEDITVGAFFLEQLEWLLFIPNIEPRIPKLNPNFHSSFEALQTNHHCVETQVHRSLLESMANTIKLTEANSSRQYQQDLKASLGITSLETITLAEAPTSTASNPSSKTPTTLYEANNKTTSTFYSPRTTDSTAAEAIEQSKDREAKETADGFFK